MVQTYVDEVGGQHTGHREGAGQDIAAGQLRGVGPGAAVRGDGAGAPRVLVLLGPK